MITQRRVTNNLSNRKKLLAISIVMLFLLVIPFSPAYSVNVYLQINSTEFTRGDTAVFTITVEISSLERIPISQLSLVIYERETEKMIVNFNVDGSGVDIPEGVTVIRISDTTTYSYGSWYAYNYGYFGYGYGYGTGQLRYTVSVNTEELGDGDYTARAYVWTGQQNPSRFESADVEFSVVPPVTPAPPPPAPPQPSLPPAEEIKEAIEIGQVDRAARQLLSGNPEDAAETLEELDPEDAGDVFVQMTRQNSLRAGEVLSNLIDINVTHAVATLDDMAEEEPATVIDLLDATPVDNIFKMPAEELIEVLVKVAVDPDILAPTRDPPTVEEAKTIIKTVLEEVARGAGFKEAWTRFFGTPEPVTAMYVKFTRDIPEVTAHLKILDAKPAGIATDVPPDKFVHTYFNITVTGAEPEDISVVQINFRIEKTWARDYSVSKLGVILYRYDDVLGDWVPLPTTLTDEDATYLYYVSSTPKLSTFAVTGATTAPTAVLRYSDLSISPSAIALGASVTVRANITNIGEEPVTRVISISLDNVFAGSTIISLGAGESTLVTFTITPDTIGNHTVRIGSLLKTFYVGLPGIRTFKVSPKVYDVTGEERTVFKPGDVLSISAFVENTVPAPLYFVYLVQIKNSRGEVVFLAATPSSIEAEGLRSVTVEYALSKPDTYTIEVFVWDRLIDPTPLSEVMKIQIEVRG